MVTHHGEQRNWNFRSRLPLIRVRHSGPGCSKLTTSLVNVSLNFSNINIRNLPIFFVEKM